MTDPSSMNNTGQESAMGRIGGEIRMLTPEEYEKAVIERDADEAVADTEDDDLSDLDEIDELLGGNE